MRWAALLVLVLAGCATPAPPPDAPGEPHPVEASWPEGLEGPFELRETLHLQVESFDGTPLDGWIFLPDVPEGVRMPVVLLDDPYLGQLNPTPDITFPITIEYDLMRAGYAVAYFSVRGTGNSGGCWEVYGPSERQDLVVLVEWLASQEWSNGRVGMMGASYSGTTPLMAAVMAPPALKAIAVAATDIDVYQLSYTPQGGPWWHSGPTPAAYWASESPLPPLQSMDPRHGTLDHAARIPERVCPEVQEMLVGGTLAGYTDDRTRAFWEARRLTLDAQNVTAAAMFSFGIRDWQTHFQDGLMWDALTSAPKRMYVGDWGHDYPWSHVEREDELRLWFDHWLKGIGPTPAGTDEVLYLDQLGAIGNTTRWPPAELREETLYLDGEMLSRRPGEGSRTFYPGRWVGGDSNALWIAGESTYDPALLLCAPWGATRTAIAYESEPVAEDTLLAGAPFAYLSLEASQPGGIVAASLFDVAPDFACDADGTEGAHAVSSGAADLRFHEGTFEGSDFPTGAPTPVRLDLHDTVHTVAAGHRLVFVVGSGDAVGRSGSAFSPIVTLHANGTADASQLVLPIVRGTLGGVAPASAFPPRPFAPSTLRGS